MKRCILSEINFLMSLSCKVGLVCNFIYSILAVNPALMFEPNYQNVYIAYTAHLMFIIMTTVGSIAVSGQ